MCKKFSMVSIFESLLKKCISFTIPEGVMKNYVVIHDGLFHADETISIALLKMFGCHFKLVRTRVEAPAGSLVLDVTPKNICSGCLVFDHHTKKDEWCRENGLHYATAGLLWQALGSSFVDKEFKYKNDVFSKEMVNRFVDHIEKAIFFGVDASDNGEMTMSEIPSATITSLISAFNAEDINDEKEQMKQFNKAVDWTITALEAVFTKENKNLKMYASVLKAIEKQKDSDVLVLESGAAWRQVINDNWEETEHFSVVVFPDKPGQWRIQSMPGSKTDFFAMRCPAPENYLSYREDPNNIKLFGGHQVIFVHPTGFIGGVYADSPEAAVEAAKDWIQKQKDEFAAKVASNI